MISAALFQSEGFIPCKDGVRLYFDGDPDLDLFLDRVESAGGRVLNPKTVITKKMVIVPISWILKIILYLSILEDKFV